MGVHITDCETARHGGWLVVVIDEPAEVHIVPKNDLVTHRVDEDCLCGPAPEMLDAGGWMYTHASLDGREAREQAQADGSS